MTTTLRTFALLAAASTLAVLATGCGARDFAPSSVSGGGITGHIFGGQQPINGAAISLYQAGTTGNGTGATNLLTASVRTAADGSFSITNDYTCPSFSTQVYLVATGGNPGLSLGTNNAASVMMAALGDCGNLSSATYVYVDEVTTIAAAWALAQFIGPSANIGSSAANATGLRNAFLIAANLANNATGLAKGPLLPGNATIQTAKLYTLANVLANCVNSDGTSLCAPLFAAATVAGVAPANTLDAALNIARHPGQNVLAVYNALPAQVPFLSGLIRVPNDWTLSITYTGGGLSSPSAIAVDSTGSVWAANYNGGVVSKLSATGVPASVNGFADPQLNENYGIAVDTQDNAWVTNEEGAHGSSNYFGSLSKFSSAGAVLSGNGIAGGGIYYPYAIAADTNGNMWIDDYGDSGASLVDNNGNSLIGSSNYYGGPLPYAIAVDASHNAWLASQGSVTRVTPAGVSNTYSCCRTPTGIAIDPAGNVWVADYPASAVVQVSAAGTTLQTLNAAGGILFPQFLAIDSAGVVYVSNFRGQSISVLGAANGGAASAILSPAAGLGIDAGLLEPFGIAIDASGNVWTANYAGNSLTEFVGMAAPVKTPLLGPPAAP